MAEIRQELILEDKFSRVLDDFMKRLENIEKIQDRLAEQAKEQNKNTDDINNKFDKLNTTALRLANNGFLQLQRRIIALGVSFFGMRSMYNSFMSSASDFDMDIRFNNRSNQGGDIIGNSRNLAMKYGGTASEYSQVTSQMARFSNTNQLERMQSIGSRLASITPGMSVSQGMGAVGNAMYNRSGTGLINQFGLNADRSQRHQVDILLQQGRLDEALDIIDELAIKAGATEKSLNNMLDSPIIKLQRFKAVLDDIRKTIGDELLNAFMPVLDAVDKLLKSEEFNEFLNMLKTGMRVAGQVLADVINFIVDNFDRISQAVKKVLPYLGIALGMLTMYKILMITLPPIIMAVKGAIALATTAQMGLNGAMAANPVGLVVIGIIALVGALTALSGVFDKVHNPFERFIGVVYACAMYLKNIFASIYNSVGEPVIQIVNIFGTLVNTILNLDKPLVALKVLFTNIFTAIGNVVLGTLMTMVERLEQFTGWITKIPGIGKALAGGLEAVKEGLQGGKDWINENKETNDAWAEAQGYKQHFRTDYEFNRMGIEDLASSYGKGADWAKEISDKFKALTNATKDNTDAIRHADNTMANVGDIINKDDWMDRFNFATTDMERQAVKTVNTTYNGGAINVSITGVADNIKQQLETQFKDFQSQLERDAKNAANIVGVAAGN